MNKRKKKNQAGEITTILTIATVLFLGVATLISTVFLKNPQTTGSKAAESCEALAANKTGGSPAGVIPGTDKKDKGGASCNLACCEFNDQCPNQQKCEIPNGYCQSGFSCNPATSMKQTCVGGSCVWQPCSGDDCSRNVCSSNSQCTGAAQPTTPPGGGGGGGGGAPGCFHMESSVDQQSVGNGVNFNVTVRFVSDGGDGDSYLYLGDRLVGGPKGWNKNYDPIWTWIPQWTGSPFFVEKLKSITLNYRGHVANSAACPGVNAFLNCTFSVDTNGTPSSSCGLSNPPSNPPTQPLTQPPATQAPTRPVTPTSGATIEPTIQPTKAITPSISKVPTTAPTSQTSIPPTNIPTTANTPIPTGTCTNYGVQPPQPGIRCPSEYTENCVISGTGSEGGSTITGTGIKHVKINCGVGVGNDSCQYSCKTIADLNTKSYSGKCDNDNTCITQETGGVSSILVTINTNLINCDGKAKIDAIGALLTDTTNGVNDKPYSKGYNPPISRNIQETFKFTVSKIPSREIVLGAFIGIKKTDGSTEGSRAQTKTYNSLSDGNFNFQINYECQ